MEDIIIEEPQKTTVAAAIDWKKTFSADEASKGLILFLIFQLVMSTAYYVVAFFNISAVLATVLMNILVDSTFIIAVWVIAYSARKDIFTCTGLKSNFKPIYILYCLLVSVISLYAFSPATNLFMELLYRIGYTSSSGGISIPNFATYLLYVFMICVLPAVCEEILFRGLVYTGLSKISRAMGIFGSAFLFMLIHGSPDQTVHQFILGVILALSFEATRTLWVPILIHFFNNFIAITVNYLFYSEVQEEAVANSSVGMNMSTYLLYTILFAAVGVYLLTLIFKGYKKAAEKNDSNQILARDLSTGGTIQSEIMYGSGGQQNIQNTEEEFFRYKENIRHEKLSSQGKILLAISIAWMALEWISALLTGFGLVVL